MKMNSPIKKSLSLLVLVFLTMSFNVHAKNAMHIVVNDHLGTPQMLINENKHVVWKANYDEFGKAHIQVEEVEFNLRFPGQYYDKETGLNYNYYRDYDPATGRYVQSDPIGILRNFNDSQMQVAVQQSAPLKEALGVYDELNQLYVYANGNPLSYIDPWGLYHCVGGAKCDFTKAMEDALQCFDTCTGRDNAITGGRGKRSRENSSHDRGEACDIGRNSNPDLARENAEECTLECFPLGYGQEEANGPSVPGTHFHMQMNTVPGGKPGFGKGIKSYAP